MKLYEIASVVQGINFTRIETADNAPKARPIKILTLEEFNEALGLPYRLAQDRKTSIWINEARIEKLQLTVENMIVVHLLTQRAASIPDIYKGLLIPSNFVVIHFHEPVDAKFIEWYFNEHTDVRRQIRLATQGTSVTSLSINMLREMDVSLPPYQLQQRLGKIIQAKQQKKKLMEERLKLEDQFVNKLLSVKLEEYK